MIEGWKIRRELLRVWRQITFLPLYPVEQGWFALHRRLRPDAYVTTEGAAPPSDAVAIFHIFQPAGLEETVLTTCRHLNARGYAVHLVSNASLSQRDITRLMPLCARIHQRPNFGLDFGGYRHVLETLDGRDLSRLLLLNDSVWFPTLRDCNLLSRLEALGADLAGPVHYDHRTPHRAHLQSYMILLSARALANPAFRAFWRNYAMSNNKVRTIRNGEMRLTETCRRAGLSVAALSTAHPDPDLTRLSPCERVAIALYDADRSGTGTGATSGQTPRGSYVLTNHPRVNVDLLNLPLLKRDRATQYQRQRAALLADRDLAKRLEPTVLKAVRSRDPRP